MKSAAVRATSASPDSLVQRLRKRIVHDYFLRVHMSLILTAVVASGVLTSKGLLEMGAFSLPFRYPVAVLGSYLVFLGLVRVWIWYVARRQSAGGFNLGNLDFSGGSGGGGGSSFGGGGGGGGAFKFGGGNSGGGGASSLWEGDAQASIVPPMPAQGGSSSSWLPSMPDIDLDLGDDGFWILLRRISDLCGADDSARGCLPGGAGRDADARFEGASPRVDGRRVQVDHHTVYARADPGLRPGICGASALPAGRKADGSTGMPGAVSG